MSRIKGDDMVKKYYWIIKVGLVYDDGSITYRSAHLVTSKDFINLDAYNDMNWSDTGGSWL